MARAPTPQLRDSYRRIPHELTRAARAAAARVRDAERPCSCQVLVLTWVNRPQRPPHPAAGGGFKCWRALFVLSISPVSHVVLGVMGMAVGTLGVRSGRPAIAIRGCEIEAYLLVAAGEQARHRRREPLDHQIPSPEIAQQSPPATHTTPPRAAVLRPGQSRLVEAASGDLRRSRVELLGAVLSTDREDTSARARARH